MEKRVGMIVQARMGSTRLPGKVLQPLDNSNTVLDLLIKRLKLSKNVDEIIIATTPDEKNSLIIEIARSHNISYFIGSEENVLERYYLCAKQFKLNVIIRITSDCPFVDPVVVDNMIEFYQNNNYDYVKNRDNSTNFPVGFDVEIFSIKILRKVYDLAKTTPEKEHVTFYIYTHPERFSIFSYNLKNLKKFDDLRLTIDEEDDLQMCREVYKILKGIGKPIDFSIFDIINIIEKNPELMNINKHIHQKKI